MIFERGFEMNYKVGDLAKITGSSNSHWFKAGETVRLKRNCGGELHVWTAEYLDGHDFWYVRESDMAPVKPATMPQKIVITTDGKTTLARLFDGKTMVKRAEAKCAPSDVFDFGVGAELAVKRLMGEKPVTEPAKEGEPVKLYCIKSYDPGSAFTKGKIYTIGEDGHVEQYDNGNRGAHCVKSLSGLCKKWGGLDGCLVPLVRRPAKVGEWVYITEDYSGHHCKPGYIYRVNFKAENDGVYFKQDGTGYVKQSEYLTLDGYTGGPV